MDTTASDTERERRHPVVELDAMYEYARRSLLAYATWMAAHEYPYLEQPEKLEYPTETWAAHEMWKSEVFNLAAKYADRQARQRFLKRGRFFFDYSTKILVGMKTRTLTRPIVLLLSHGYMQASFARHPDADGAPPGPAAPMDFGMPSSSFVPQKERARKRLVVLAAALGVLALAGALFVLI